MNTMVSHCLLAFSKLYLGSTEWKLIVLTYKLIFLNGLSKVEKFMKFLFFKKLTFQQKWQILKRLLWSIYRTIYRIIRSYTDVDFYYNDVIFLMPFIICYSLKFFFNVLILCNIINCYFLCIKKNLLFFYISFYFRCTISKSISSIM